MNGQGRFLGIFILTVLLISGCGRNNSHILAKVGDRIITRDEFIFNLEFAPRKITWQHPEKAKGEYLDQMIRKILLAKEGEKRGYASDPGFQKALEFYKGREIVRELYRKHIRDSVEVSEHELRKAYDLSKKTLYVQHFVAGSREEAEKIRSGEISPRIVPLLPGKKMTPVEGYGMVEKISYNEVNQEIEDLLYSLPLREFSQPLLKKGKFHLFRVVNTEFDLFLTEHEFQSKLPSLRKIIRRRKEHQAAFEFVRRVMKPQKVVIKGDALTRLTDLILSYHRPAGVLEKKYVSNRELTTIASESQQFLNTLLARYSEGAYNAADFLFDYKMHPLELSFSSENALRESLKNCIATYVRDRVFRAMGYREGLDHSPRVIEEEKNWRETLLAEMVKDSIIKQNKENESDGVQNRIDELTDRLRSEYRIKIYSDVLDGIELSAEGYAANIDFVAFPLQ